MLGGLFCVNVVFLADCSRAPRSLTPVKGRAMDASQNALAERLRAALSGHAVREVNMFGGISFLVDEHIAVASRRWGELLVHVRPADHDAFLERPDTEVARMGQRVMGDSWIVVPDAHGLSDEALAEWIEVAVHASTTAAEPSSS